MPAPNPLALPAGVRSPIAIQAQTGAPDASGGPMWQTIFKGVGVIATLSSREVYQASQFTSQVTHSVSMAYQFGITISGGMRLLFRSRTFQIQTVDNVQERNRILKLACLEINGGQ